MFGYIESFFRQFDYAALLDAATRALAVLVCLTVHETCHGLAALALGDPTAKQMHRLSMNPLRHIDWLGLLSMFLLGFGWAKPVPVDPRYFKHPKQGMALTALAGPVSNFVLAFLCILLVRGAAEMTAGGGVLFWVVSFLLTTAILSIGLGLFNLVPIPPLDGSKVLFSILPERAYSFLLRYERYGMLLLFAVIFLDIGGDFLTRAIQTVYYFMVELVF